MKYLKTLAFEFITLLTLILITTILYYFNLISTDTNMIFKIIIFIITFVFTGIYIGRKSNKKYYLEGLKIGVINIILFLITSLITKYNFNFKQFIYYIIIIITIMLGSIIGGNFKKNKNKI